MNLNKIAGWLYILSFLHQTTTIKEIDETIYKLYILSFLHQTTTYLEITSFKYTLYILSFLHQTTTRLKKSNGKAGCISYHFYIKPQH